jgi:hypothetical protein
VSKQTKARLVRRTTDKPAEPSEPQLTQREKFIQAAREAECDETGEMLDEALRTIARAGKR